MSKLPKELEVISFKVDADLAKLIKGIDNRSEFIRAAILQALDDVCPFCQGSGVLDAHRKKHWQQLKRQHKTKECEECHQPLLVCEH